MPAAVLFATVFAIGGFTRHSEVTAAKASGISFYRLILPIMVGAVLATGIDWDSGEASAYGSRWKLSQTQSSVAPRPPGPLASG